MPNRSTTSPRWDRQAPALDPSDVVNYSGSVAAGLHFESASGKVISLNSSTFAHLFETLRRYNPLWDGSAAAVRDSGLDRLHQWFAAHVADAWNLTDLVAETRRLYRVLRPEGHDLPAIRPLDAVQAVVRHEVIFFRRRDICRARLSAVGLETAADAHANSPVRLKFKVIPDPDLVWSHGSPFTVGASDEFIQIGRGYLSISTTNVEVITAPELVADVRALLASEPDPLRRLHEIRRRLERLPPDPGRARSPPASPE